MKQEKVLELKSGLYQIHWKAGGMSLAAIGVNHNGTRWMAPTNWTTTEGNAICPGPTKYIWKKVKKVVLIGTN